MYWISEKIAVRNIMKFSPFRALRRSEGKYEIKADGVDKIVKDICHNISAKHTHIYNQKEMLEYLVVLIATMNTKFSPIDWEMLIMKKFATFSILKKCENIVDAEIGEDFKYDDEKYINLAEIHGRMYGYYEWENLFVIGCWENSLFESQTETYIC